MAATVPDGEDFDLGRFGRNKQVEWAFSAARDLRDWVQRLVLEVESTNEWRVDLGELDGVFLGTFARGTQTFRAALLLCDRGYCEQTAMLNRSLFEHMVVAWWTSLQDDGDDIIDRLRRHHDHARVLYERASAQHPELEMLPPYPELLDEAYVKSLDKLFGRHGGQWHGKRLDQLVREVEERWDEPHSGSLWKFFRFVNYWNNQFLHHSSVGINQLITWNPVEEGPLVVFGPTGESMVASLWAAHWSYGLLVLCTLRQLSPERVQGFREFFEALDYRYRVFTRDQVKDVGRNDECPCGSGKKFKHCHESYVIA